MAEIFPLFQDFGILSKIGYFVGDNYPLNDVLCRFLESKLEKSWDSGQHWLRCNGYIINLAV